MHKKKHYPLMPGKESPHTIMVRIPKYEYEELKAIAAKYRELTGK